MISRRQFVGATAASWLAPTFLGSHFNSAHAKSAIALDTGIAAQAPRYFVTFFLRGGLDAVTTTDPKSKADVQKDVDVPYDRNAIIDAGALQFGPHFKGLERWAKHMAIVRGIQVKTANHETGAFQMMRMRTRVTPQTATFGEVVGLARDGQPLATVTLGELSTFEHSPGAFVMPTNNGNSALEALDDLGNDEIAALARAYAAHEKSLRSAQTERGRLTHEYVQQTAALFDKLKSTPRFNGGASGKKKAARADNDFDRTLWLLENDLTRSVTVKVFFDWDSHFRNAEKQAPANRDLVRLLDSFLQGLSDKKNAHGRLIDQTVVVVGSEMGRFPVLNGNLGKDHWPETTLMFFGKGINTGANGAAFGETGPFMEGKKLDKNTGKVSDSGSHVTLDDVGTTLVAMTGLDPQVYGYHGERLRFLERT